MAKHLTLAALGASSKAELEAETVRELLEDNDVTTQNVTVTVNGEVAEIEDFLEDYSYVTVTQQTKGGL